MKYLKYIAAALLLLGTLSCKKAVNPFVHDDVTITSMVMSSTGFDIVSTLEATIDQEAGTIVFAVPRADRSKFDLTKVKLSATIWFDASISPKLSDRLWDVTKDEDGNPRITLTVTSDQTGTTKQYQVWGYVSSK
ncbi:MAG: hypothetical protein IJ652_05400 [Bacteroidales bacterium]|nr:hypothetical protein [Bacteroidales bacterium]